MSAARTRPGPARDLDGTPRTRSTKGERRRAGLVAAAAEIVLAEGPQAVSHRAVAARAGSSLSATTYYFAGREELLRAAGQLLMSRWAERAEAVADRAEVAVGARPPAGRAEEAGARPPADRAEVLRSTEVAPRRGDERLVAALLAALLPPAGQVRGHYQQLLGAGTAPELARAYRSGRQRLDDAVRRLLRAHGSPCAPELAVAVVDGAVVSALSEGRDVAKTAALLLPGVL